MTNFSYRTTQCPFVVYTGDFARISRYNTYLYEGKECGYCKAQGYLIKACMVFYDPERCEPKPAKSRSHTECRYCYKNTHLIKECPRLTRKIREKKERESRENAAQKLRQSLSSIGYTMVAHQ